MLARLSLSLPARIWIGPLAFGLPALLAACVGQPPRVGSPAVFPDLDSLNRVVEHNDSVEANYFFYEDAFTAYRGKFPGVDRPAYMAVARGKDRAFCLFQPDPARRCLDVGEKFKALGLGEPARDAFEAGLLSEGVNGDTLNIRLWSGMAQLHSGWREYDRARPFLIKVLEVDRRNKRARNMLASIPREIPMGIPRERPREAAAAEGARKPPAMEFTIK